MSAKNNSFVYSTLSHPSHRAGPISRRPHQHLRPRDQIPTLVNDLVEARQDHKAPGLIRATSTLLLLPPLELERARLRRDPHPDVERHADDLGEVLCRRLLFPVAERSWMMFAVACRRWSASMGSAASFGSRHDVRDFQIA
jgi:hypothetical protein